MVWIRYRLICYEDFRRCLWNAKNMLFLNMTLCRFAGVKLSQQQGYTFSDLDVDEEKFSVISRMNSFILNEIKYPTMLGQVIRMW